MLEKIDVKAIVFIPLAEQSRGFMKQKKLKI